MFSKLVTIDLHILEQHQRTPLFIGSRALVEPWRVMLKVSGNKDRKVDHKAG